ncbi:hypothetical protein AXG93_2646s1060 [Marchantia polymorpha subsp. ruderalis]|uniref:Uncharacterized protein n=1 Tax=Marchantia polymorpha subsp. ruderalis TaxID=1480154 RepID=A0A176W4P6_MARPO|nr:hypothetical protein AXG93_2646s1060 [Marchantia polymorpha subsp. ruderalis]
MHAQSQAPNQSLGQVSRMAQPNGSSLSGSSAQGHRTWHQESDNLGLRRTVVDNMCSSWLILCYMRYLLLITSSEYMQSLSLFQKRRGPVTAEWQQKLPDFVKRLEEGLYRQAMTKVVNIDMRSSVDSSVLPLCLFSLEM